MAQTKSHKIDDSIQSKGVVTFTKYFIDTPRARLLDRIISKMTENKAYATSKGLREKVKQLMVELDMICQKEKLVINNLCVKSGRNVFAQRLAGEYTYTGTINYGLLGTGSVAVSDSDVQLGAEVKRKSVATVTRVDDQVNFDFYYSKSDYNGAINEFGMVIDGTATAGTGVLFNRLLTGGWTKSSAESMTVSVQININHA